MLVTSGLSCFSFQSNITLLDEDDVSKTSTFYTPHRYQTLTESGQIIN
ncbi:MAG: hypothetical protein HPY60_11215 [Candidatus Methanofastidiosum sp.]|nr:hypothetical protein [Methanofastidiosum sp.]